MRSKRTRRFRQMLQRLPAHVRQQARDAYDLFRRDPFHPSLHFKRVNAQEPIYSVRVGINYRALGIRDSEDEIVWFWIGPHADYDKLL